MDFFLELILLLGLLPFALSVPTTMSPSSNSSFPAVSGGNEGFNVNQITDRFLFDISVNEFVQVRDRKEHGDVLEWVSNGCSIVADNPSGFKFKDSCNRHDFGYRNYKKQCRFYADSKERIDKNFHKDMKEVCNHGKHKTTCKMHAWSYYKGVRWFGKKQYSDC